MKKRWVKISILSALLVTFIGCALVNDIEASTTAGSEKLNSTIQIATKTLGHSTAKKAFRQKGSSKKEKESHTKKKLKVTAYSYSKHTTASGTKVRPGVVAVSRNLFKIGWEFGKRISIDGQLYVIEDILPSRHNGIDIFMSSKMAAKEYGCQTKLVTLLID